MDLLEDFLNLVLPSRCVLCKELGSPICLKCCTLHLAGRRVVNRFDLSGFAVREYDSTSQVLIREFKENHQTQIATAMAKSVAQLLPSSCKVLVPIPSKKSSFQNRGFVPAKLLAHAVRNQVAKHDGRLIQVIDVLRFQRLVQDQAALSGHDRRKNLTGAFTLKAPVRAQEVWLIDDVVTTGATMLEARRCLNEAGVGVGGFLSFAETLPKNQQKRPAKTL
jgi:ComF family protein